MAGETFAAARVRIIRELMAQGLRGKPDLKVPWVELPSGHKLWFKSQAVYLDEHSLWLDIRGMSTAAFVHRVRHALQVRSH